MQKLLFIIIYLFIVSHKHAFEKCKCLIFHFSECCIQTFFDQNLKDCHKKISVNFFQFFLVELLDSLKYESNESKLLEVKQVQIRGICSIGICLCIVTFIISGTERRIRLNSQQSSSTICSAAFFFFSFFSFFSFFAASSSPSVEEHMFVKIKMLLSTY